MAGHKGAMKEEDVVMEDAGAGAGAGVGVEGGDLPVVVAEKTKDTGKEVPAAASGGGGGGKKGKGKKGKK